MYTVTLSKNLRLTLPSAFRKFLKRGNKFAVYESDDAIMLKQIHRRPWPAELPPVVPPMPLEEIDRIVHEYRKKPNKAKR